MAKTANTMHVKKGDLVRVLAGKDRGVEGKIISVDPERGRVIVEGANRIKKHTKTVEPTGRQAKSGGIITQEAPIDVSNVALLVEVDGKKVTTRVGYKRVEVEKHRADGSVYTTTRSQRVARRTGEEI